MTGMPLRLLLVEDSAYDVELVLVTLERIGYQVEPSVAYDHDTLFRLLSEQVFDLIISDYILPGFSGQEALLIARQLAPETPFLFLSGIYGEENAVEMMREGAVDYVLKNNLALLPRAVERALSEVRERRERQRISDELRKVEVRSRLAMDASDLGMWEYDPRTRQLFCDSRCRAMYGVAEEAEIGLPGLYVRCDLQDRRGLREAMTRGLSLGAVDEFQAEWRIRLANGEVRWLSARGREFSSADTGGRFVGVLMDITTHKQTHYALARLNSILGERVDQRTRERDRTWELSRDLLCVVHADLRPVMANPAWASLLGLDDASLRAQPLYHWVHPLEVQRTRDEICSVSLQNCSTHFANRMRHRDGSYRSISWSVVLDDGLLYMVGRDITSQIAVIDELAAANRRLSEQIAERERMEQTLHQMQRMEAIGQLTAGIAHDFNNLLTIVLMNANFLHRDLQQGKPLENCFRRLQHIREAGDRGARLTGQLLAFSRRQRLTPEPVDLNRVVAAMLELLTSTLGGNISIEPTFADDLWLALVDPTQIELIILNLAINARDAMPQGGSLSLETGHEQIRQRAVRPESPDVGDYVVLTVRDSGTGMSGEVLAKALEPFFTTKDVGKGSGLGLPQVFGFAKQSGGGVEISSTPGQGTCVKVYLPRSEAGTAVEAELPAPVVTDARAARTQRILLVDDDPGVRDITRAMLEHLGYRVCVAHSGARAMEMLVAVAYDLLLVDYAMPGMNGAELAGIALARHPGLPVIFITGYAEFDRLNRQNAVVVHKPFSEEQLSQALEQALRSGASACGDSGYDQLA